MQKYFLLLLLAQIARANVPDDSPPTTPLSADSPMTAAAAFAGRRRLSGNCPTNSLEWNGACYATRDFNPPDSTASMCENDAAPLPAGWEFAVYSDALAEFAMTKNWGTWGIYLRHPTDPTKCVETCANRMGGCTSSDGMAHIYYSRTSANCWDGGNLMSAPSCTQVLFITKGGNNPTDADCVLGTAPVAADCTSACEPTLTQPITTAATGSGTCNPATYACQPGDGACPPPATWDVGAWDVICSASCGGGTQSRTVSCSTGTASDCDSSTMPAATQSCNIFACPTWDAKPTLKKMLQTCRQNLKKAAPSAFDGQVQLIDQIKDNNTCSDEKYMKFLNAAKKRLTKSKKAGRWWTFACKRILKANRRYNDFCL